MSTRWKLALLSACSCAVLLAACGGGGAGAPAVPLPLARLNDTGVAADQCFAEGSNAFVACSSPQARALSTMQDGQLGRDAVAATNSNSDGKLGFQFSAVPGGCVHDEVTGLTWESKTADGGLHDGSRGYTNYGDGRPGDASEFVNAVNLAGLCGAADWRLPTLQELNSLVDYGAMISAPPYIDPTWFPNTMMTSYWTLADSKAPASSRISFVDFRLRYFSTEPGDRSGQLGVRLVRGGNALVPAQTRFTPSADAQEVTDAQTGLVWRRCLEGMQFAAGSCTGTFTLVSHEQALKLAAAQATSTGAGWRLPNAKELLSLSKASWPDRDTVAFPAVGSVGGWASTPCGSGAAAVANSFVTFPCLARNLTAGVQLVRDPS